MSKKYKEQVQFRYITEAEWWQVILVSKQAQDWHLAAKLSENKQEKRGNPKCTKQIWVNAGSAQSNWLSAQVASSGPALQSR